MDSEGKDSFRLKHSGSIISGVFTNDGIGMVRDFDDREDLDRIIGDVFNEMDLVLIEGYKLGKYPKILVMKEQDLAHEIKEFNREEIVAVLQSHRTLMPGRKSGFLRRASNALSISLGDSFPVAE